MPPVQPPENLRTRKRTEIALREERGWQGGMGNWKTACPRTVPREFTYAKADGNCSARRKGLAGGYAELENSMSPVQPPENLRTRKRTEIALREERGWQGGMRNWNKKWRKLWE